MFFNRFVNLIRNDIKNISLPRNYSSVVTNAKIQNENKAKLLQENALDEMCILVDKNDCVLGSTTKRDCHSVYDGNHIKLHRAFSVFLFNSNGDMLIQRRAKEKVIYCFLFFFYIFVLFFILKFHSGYSSIIF